MKSTNLFLSAIAAFCLLFIFSCKPDTVSPKLLGPQMEGLAGSLGSVSKVDGMLSFPSNEVLDQVLADLDGFREELNNHITQQADAGIPMSDYPYADAVLSVKGPFGGKNPLNSLPINLQLTDFEKTIMDEDPISYLFEKTFDIKSLRYQILFEHYNLEKAGTFHPTTNNPDDFFMPSETMRLIMNPQLEVKIGGKILKVVSSSATLVLEECAGTELNDLRNLFNMPLDWTSPEVGPSFEDVIDSYQIGPNTCIMGYPTIGISPGLLPCDARPGSSNTQNVREVEFFHSSVGNYASVLWSFGDGNTSTLDNPTHTYATDGQYTITLTLVNANGTTCASSTIDLDLGGTCTANFDFAIGPHEIGLTNTSSPINNVLSEEYFVNGVSVGSQPGVLTNLPIGPYMVCLRITTFDGCVDTRCKQLFVLGDCCIARSIQKSSEIPVGGNRFMVAKGWITNNLGRGEVQSKTTCYRYNNVIGWQKTRANNISAAIEGSAFRWIEASETCDNVIDVADVTGTERSRPNRKSITSESISESFELRITRNSMTSVHGMDAGGGVLNNYLQNVGFMGGSGHSSNTCEGD